jgi:steroid 5-alpha reductase family enzyme
MCKLAIFTPEIMLNMLRTILLLIATLVALPFVAFYYDQPLLPEHWATLKTLLGIMLGVAITCFVVSELTGNCSQVDKLWSIIPLVYVWVVAADSGFADRLVLMAVLVTIWGARLTFNFARRGGYHWIPWKGEEDYRWSVLRSNPLLSGRLSWALFNLFFISLYQNSLILLFTLPAIAAWQGGSTPLNWLDYLAAAMFIGFVVMETVADQQQWDFQKEKYRRIQAGEELGEVYGRGFAQSGLWAWVRHPNYAAEQAIWLSFYLFSVAATDRWLNWSLAGAVLLMLLFLGSSDFSEKISVGKYPAYVEYQKRVGRFLPKVG